ncbi:MAG: hypothetical protein Tsb0014_39180 [Pleurocapsa sp.]
MKLKYREVAYEYNPNEIATVKGKVGGKYRGVCWQQKIPQIAPTKEFSADLKYRSVPYHKDRIRLINVASELDEAVVTHTEMLPEKQTVKQ